MDREDSFDEEIDVSDSADTDEVVAEDTKQPHIFEKIKRARAIRSAKVVFRAIDILFQPSQNACPYVKKGKGDKITCRNDIAYAGDEVCKFDFYSVKQEQKMPAIILIHGGGFTAGDKKYRKGRAQFFALNGFGVFCINYGLAPEYTFPQPVLHIVAAANYIYDHADEYNIDANRIFVGGDSAGGYYSAMLAAFNGNDKFKEAFGVAPKFKIFGAMFNCGLYDMDTVLNSKYPFDLADGVLLSLTGIRGSDFDGYEHKDVCAPIDFVTKEFPPTFLIYSDYDSFCKGQGNLMRQKLDDMGVYCEYYSARHMLSNHCFSLMWSGEDAAAANELMLSFAKRLAADKIKL